MVFKDLGWKDKVAFMARRNKQGLQDYTEAVRLKELVPIMKLNDPKETLPSSAMIVIVHWNECW